VYALNRATGRTEWTEPIASGGGQIACAGAPAVRNGLVYTAWPTLKALYADTGRPLWERSDLQASYSMCSPAVSGRRAYVAVGAGAPYYTKHGLYAVERTSGRTLWFAATGDTYFSSPSVAGGVVYVVGATTEGVGPKVLYAFDGATGKRLWRRFVGRSRWITVGIPAVARGVVFYPSPDGWLYALGARTGSVLWRARVGHTDASAAVANGVVYVVGARDVLTAFRATDGDVLWRSRLPSKEMLVWIPSPIIASGSVYAATRAGVLLAFRVPR
jgi:outer membrane protein assembly factor BamB